MKKPCNNRVSALFAPFSVFSADTLGDIWFSSLSIPFFPREGCNSTLPQCGNRVGECVEIRCHDPPALVIPPSVLSVRSHAGRQSFQRPAPSIVRNHCPLVHRGVLDYRKRKRTVVPPFEECAVCIPTDETPLRLFHRILLKENEICCSLLCYSSYMDSRRCTYW